VGDARRQERLEVPAETEKVKTGEKRNRKKINNCSLMITSAKAAIVDGGGEDHGSE